MWGAAGCSKGEVQGSCLCKGSSSALERRKAFIFNLLGTFSVDVVKSCPSCHGFAHRSWFGDGDQA